MPGSPASWSPSSAMCRSSSTWTTSFCGNRTATHCCAFSPSSSSSPSPNAWGGRAGATCPSAIPRARRQRLPPRPPNPSPLVATSWAPASRPRLTPSPPPPCRPPPPTGTRSTSIQPSRSPCSTIRTTSRPWCRDSRAAPLVGLDAETSSLEPHEAELVGLSLAASPTEVWYLPFGHRPAAGRARRAGAGQEPPGARRLCPRPRGGAARGSLRPEGRAQHQVRLAGAPAGRGRAGRCSVRLDARELRSRSRPPLALHRHALPRAFRPADADLRTISPVAARRRCRLPRCPCTPPRRTAATDSATVLALHDFFAPALREIAMEPLLRDIEMPLVAVLTDMEWEGIAIDPAVFARLGAELGAELRRLEGEIATVAGEALNLNSPRQLATILFEKQQLPVLKRTKTGPSTDADVLEQLAGHGTRAAARSSWSTASSRSSRAPTWTRCRPPSTARPDGFTPASTRPVPPPDVSARRIPTCRTFRSAPRAARRSGAGSFRAPAGISRRRLLPDRAAHHGAPLGGPGLHRGVPSGR